MEPLEMFWPTCNNQQSYGQMDVKHTPPTPHAATPRIQVSNSLYFTLYFTLYFASTVMRHGTSTLRTSTCCTAPSHQTGVYCILVIELLLLLLIFSIVSVSIFPLLFHGFGVEQRQRPMPRPHESKKEGKKTTILFFLFQLQPQSAPPGQFVG